MQYRQPRTSKVQSTLPIWPYKVAISNVRHLSTWTCNVGLSLFFLSKLTDRREEYIRFEDVLKKKWGGDEFVAVETARVNGIEGAIFCDVTRGQSILVE